MEGITMGKILVEDKKPEHQHPGPLVVGCAGQCAVPLDNKTTYVHKTLIHIYCIYFPTSNKRYIGQTDNLKRRMYAHQLANSLVGKALRKYNNWTVTTLHTVYARDESNRIEIEEIRNFNSVVPYGYNITRGGDGWSTGMKHTDRTIKKMQGRKSPRGFQGREHSAETKQKMRFANLGEKNPNYGKHLTKETRDRISAYRLGMKHKPHTEEAKAKMSKAALNRPPMSDATKAKISASLKGGKHSPESKAKMSRALTGKKHGPMSAEHKAKISSTLKRIHHTAVKARAVCHTPEAKAKRRETYAKKRRLKGEQYE